MELEITPEPEPEEREAIRAALERLLAGGERPSRGAWWEAGVRESAGEEPEAEAPPEI